MSTNCVSFLNIIKFLMNNTSKICAFIAAFYITVLKYSLEWYCLPWKYCVVINNILIGYLTKSGFWVAAAITWPVLAVDLVNKVRRVKVSRY